MPTTNALFSTGANFSTFSSLSCGTHCIGIYWKASDVSALDLKQRGQNDGILAFATHLRLSHRPRIRQVSLTRKMICQKLNSRKRHIPVISTLSFRIAAKVRASRTGFTRMKQDHQQWKRFSPPLEDPRTVPRRNERPSGQNRNELPGCPPRLIFKPWFRC